MVPEKFQNMFNLVLLWIHVLAQHGRLHGGQDSKLSPQSWNFLTDLKNKIYNCYFHYPVCKAKWKLKKVSYSSWDQVFIFNVVYKAFVLIEWNIMAKSRDGLKLSWITPLSDMSENKNFKGIVFHKWSNF